MRILGIDPGLKITGYGCVELAEDARPGDEPALIEAGVLRFDSRQPMAHRLAQLHHDLGDVIDELDPQQLAVEQLYSHYRHVRTSILMGHARGVVLLAGQLRGLAIEELAATEVKKAVTGNGHASKQQIQHAMMEHFQLHELPEPPDVADAMAIALCSARRLSGSGVAG